MKTPVLFTLLVACSSLVSAAEPLVITKENAATFYRDFQRLTKEPHYVAPLTAMLCRTPSKEMVEKEKAMTGPHHQSMIYIYANAIAAKSIAAKGEAFPEGAVIVKEKLGDEKQPVTGVGGMVKRAKGYDAANGDWEFFYYTPGGDFTTGKLVNCIDCHNGGKRDHVFHAWKLGAQ